MRSLTLWRSKFRLICSPELGALELKRQTHEAWPCWAWPTPKDAVHGYLERPWVAVFFALFLSSEARRLSGEEGSCVGREKEKGSSWVLKRSLNDVHLPYVEMRDRDRAVFADAYLDSLS